MEDSMMNIPSKEPPAVTCKTCGQEEYTHHMKGEVCVNCYDKTPEAIKTRLARKEARARKAMDRHVSPEIRLTDVAHPDFNREAWDKFKQNFDGKLWPWFHSDASGQSKTRMAYLIGLSLYRDNPRMAEKLQYLKWVDGDQLADACRTRNIYSYGDKVMKDARDTVEACRKVTVLIIDDLMKRNWTSKAASDGLWEIVKHRHQCHLLTIITDNVSPAEIEDRIHPDHAAFIIRRLAERALCVECD